MAGCGNMEQGYQSQQSKYLIITLLLIAGL